MPASPPDSDCPLPAGQRPRSSSRIPGRLERTILTRLAAITLSASLLAGGIAYALRFHAAMDRAKAGLIKEAELVAANENRRIHSHFENLESYRELYLRQREQIAPGDAIAAFQNLAEKLPDNSWKERATGPAGAPRTLGILVPSHTAITPELARTLVAATHICAFAGPVAVKQHCTNLYITTTESAAVYFWPEFASINPNLRTDSDFAHHPVTRAAGKEENAARGPALSRVYRDTINRAHIVSAVIPVDLAGAQIALIAQDMPIAEMEARIRTSNDPAASHTLLLSNGQSILHIPPGADATRKKTARAAAPAKADPREINALQQAVALASTARIVDLPDSGRIAALAPLPELNGFYAITIPRSHVLQLANADTLPFVIAMLGIFAGQFIITAFVLRREIVARLARLSEATRAFTRTGTLALTPDDRNDDISDLAKEFQRLGRAVADRDQALKKQNELLEQRVQDRTADLARATAAAETAAKTKSLFLSQLSHEFRTPLNAVVGFAQLLAEDPRLAPEHARRVASIGRAGETLIELINDVSDMARAENDTLHLDNRPVELGPLIASIGKIIDAECRDKGIAMRLIIGSDLPSSIRGDALRIRQILTTILHHAVLCSEAGEISLIVRTAAGADLPAIACEIRDNGPGLPPRGENALFDAFTPKTGARALKLALARDLARKMAGDITAENAPGGGTLYRFTFRATPAPAEPVRREPAASPATKKLLEGRLPPRILIVDDLAENRSALLDNLARLGLTDCREAADGAAALTRLQEESIDLIITDLDMPGMTGHDLLHAIRADTKLRNLPVVAHTTLPADAPTPAGFDDLLPKPHRLERLRDLLAKHLVRSEIGSTKNTPKPFPDRKALIIDDDPMNREVLGIMLAQLGFQVAAASDGLEGLALLSSQPADIVFFDAHMPRLNGLEMITRHRASPGGRDTRAVCISGIVSEVDRRRLAAAGVSRFLPKPFRVHDLRAVTEQLLAPQA